jgi:hypothetical protein
MYRFYEDTFRDLMSLVQWTRINGIQEMHDTAIDCVSSTCCYPIYLHTSNNNFFKIITGFMLTIKCQVVGEKPCLKTFYSIEEPMVYV